MLIFFPSLNAFFPPPTNNGYWGNDGVFLFGFYEKEDEDEFPLPPFLLPLLLLLRIDSRILSPRKILNGGFLSPVFNARGGGEGETPYTHCNKRWGAKNTGHA